MPRERADETAVRLARKYGADETLAARAAAQCISARPLTKALSGADEQIEFCRHPTGIPSRKRRQERRCGRGIAARLHGKTAAWCAREIFGECEEVCSAIAWHTTGRADMTLLEKIIYIADYVEPTRDFPGVDALREAVWRDLDEGVLLGLEQTLRLLESQGRSVCSASRAARDYLVRERKSL